MLAIPSFLGAAPPSKNLFASAEQESFMDELETISNAYRIAMFDDNRARNSFVALLNKKILKICIAEKIINSLPNNSYSQLTFQSNLLGWLASYVSNKKLENSISSCTP